MFGASLFVRLRIPKLFHLRRDPYERADTDSISYNVWWENNSPQMAYGSAKAVAFAQTFKEFPARQAPGSFTISKVIEQLTKYRGKQQ